MLLPNQRQHRTLHTQEDLLPYALCWRQCPVSAALPSISRMDSIPTSYWPGAAVCTAVYSLFPTQNVARGFIQAVWSLESRILGGG